MLAPGRGSDLAGWEGATTGSVETGPLEAGERALHTEGDLATSRQWFDLAYREAERRDDATEMGRAALGLGGLWLHEHRSAAPAALVELRQRYALSRLGQPATEPVNTTNTSLAVRLRIRLAAEADYRNGTYSQTLGLVAVAKRTGDPVALAEALSLAHHCLLGPDHAALRYQLAQELTAVGLCTDRRGDLLMGLLWQTVDLFLADDPRPLRLLAELGGLLAGRDNLAIGYVVRAIETMLHIRAGRFVRAEEQAADCALAGAVAGDLDVTGWYGGQLAAIRWFQGRAGELIGMLSDLAHSPSLRTVDHSYHAALAIAAAAAGDHRQAAGALARLQVLGLSELPRSSSWLVAMYGVVEAAYLLGDADIAADAYRLMRPFASLPMMASLGVVCFGSTHHALGVAALTTGDLPSAVRHLRAAVRHNLALAHWPAVALSRWRLGRALGLRGTHGDRAEANEQRAIAMQEAARLGMALSALDRAGGEHPDTDHVRADPGPDRGDTDPPPDPGGEPVRMAAHGEQPDQQPERVSCRRQGRLWRIEMGPRTALVAHSVGLQHLAVLLANPGREIRAIDLVAGPGSPEVAAIVGSEQPILDEVARREYRLRLSQLDREIEEAEASQDWGRAARLQTDRDWLIDELAAATGLRGRDRQFVDGQERARVAVSKAVRRALARIAEAAPVIGAELRATIYTGRSCAYRPG